MTETVADAAAASRRDRARGVVTVALVSVALATCAWSAVVGRRDPLYLALVLLTSGAWVHIAGQRLATRKHREARNATAAALRASEQRFRTLTESASDPIISTSADGRVVFWNPAAVDAFGWSEAEAVGQPCDRFILHAEQGTFAAILVDLEANRQSPLLGRRIERTAVRKDGRRFQVELSLSTRLEGTERFFTSVVRDITERKAVEAQLRDANSQLHDANEQMRQANQRLLDANAQLRTVGEQFLAAKIQAESADRYKTAFLANTSHEVRTPMNVLLGMIELLSRTQLDDNQAKLLRSARHAGEHLLAVVDDVLDFSKVGSGQLELEKIAFDVREAVDQAVELFTHRAHQKQLALVVRIADGVPAQVLGDPHRLRQVLINLIGNAVKFTEQGGVTITVHAEARPLLRFEVADTGIGIPLDKQGVVFDAFTQVDTSTTRQHGGTGLGLAISKGLVERMGGSLQVESQPGRGARFSFTAALPARTPSTSLPQEAEDASVAVAERMLHGGVLVADGHPMQRRAVAEGLARFQARVCEAADGDAALTALRQQGPFAFLIVDTRLPGTGGIGLVMAMREQLPPPWPAVVLAREDEDSLDVDRMLTAGVVSTLRKPVKRASLAVALAAALSAKAQPTALSAPDLRAGGSAPPTLRVLLVEDAPDNRLLVRAFLRDQGWQIDEACNGLEALELWQPGRYNLVLMDVQMPVLDGYAATRQIRLREQEAGVPPVPIVALTAHALPEARTQSAEAGCTAHVVKPFRRGQLLDIVRSLAVTTVPTVSPRRPERVAIEAMLLPLVPDYLAHRREDVASVRHAVQQADFDSVRLIGHSMKGSGGSYGFDAISEIGDAIDAAAVQQDARAALAGADRLEAYLRDVEVIPA